MAVLHVLALFHHSISKVHLIAAINGAMIMIASQILSKSE